MAQVIDHLPIKPAALSSNSSTTKKRKVYNLIFIFFFKIYDM
jgi:hypothetical protein